MSLSLQVLYPTDNGSTFDHDYYMSKHMEVVANSIRGHIERVTVTKGIAGGPNVPAGYHAIATILFADKAAMDAAMASVGPAVADIANIYNGTPQMLIGEVVAAT
ncbi:MAG: EthD family reductase [Dongiaceae bacterium]